MAIRGRGVEGNPPNRFESLQHSSEGIESDPKEGESSPKTEFIPDSTKSIIAYNDSPDIGFDAGINPYRGCEHGCSYCYARPTHEYLGYSAGLDFETKIVVKERAPELLREELSKPGWRPRVLALSGVTDPYQPVERRLRLTRRSLEVLVEFRNPVVVITKNALVCRDQDLLSELARHNAAAVCLSVTTLDPALCGILEPRTSRPAKRLEAIGVLASAGIPVCVMVAPVIPGLTDSEIPAIIAAAARAGARFAGMVPLRLPHAVAPIFEQWLSEHMPQRKEKILNRIRAIRGGRLNDPNFGSRMRGEGIFAEQIRALFDLACRKSGISPEGPELSTEHFVCSGKQQSLF